MESGNDSSSKQRLAELLKRLQTEAVPAKTTLEGRATTRTENALQLAISTGIVTIPIEEIEDVSFLDPSDQTLVSLDIRDSSKVVHVQPTVTTSSAIAPLLNIGGGGGGVQLGTGTGYYIDSVTRTGGKADKTDDTNWVQKLDDYYA